MIPVDWHFEKLFDLSGRVALITGAGSGFGEIISIGFAQYGCDVAAADVNLETAKRTSERVRAIGRRGIAVQADVSALEQVTDMVKTTLSSFGTLDILVNSAGIPQHDPAENVPIETWNRVLNINLRGTFLSCQAAGRVMLDQGKGTIINLSSIGGVVGLGRGTNAFGASKGGVNTLTKELALEWGPRGVRVNALAPCQFRTPALLEVMADPQFDPQRLMQTWISNIPLGRIGEPEEILGPALFLASDASSMVTGVILPVDGGYLAR
jgi:gluconate 5-dehydrogenase